MKLSAAGFTHHGPPNPHGKVRCFFKSNQGGNADPEWQTYLSHIQHKQGALAAGNDIEVGQYTLEEACLRCLQLPAAVGFTYSGAPDPQGKLTCYFKSKPADGGKASLGAVPAQQAPVPVVMATAVSQESTDSAGAALVSFLTSHRLAGYIGPLVELGAEEPVDLTDLQEEDLDGIGMKKLERNRLDKALEAGGFKTPDHQEPKRREQRRQRLHHRRAARRARPHGGRGGGLHHGAAHAHVAHKHGGRGHHR